MAAHYRFKLRLHAFLSVRWRLHYEPSTSGGWSRLALFWLLLFLGWQAAGSGMACSVSRPLLPVPSWRILQRRKKCSSSKCAIDSAGERAFDRVVIKTARYSADPSGFIWGRVQVYWWAFVIQLKLSSGSAVDVSGCRGD